MNKLSIIILSAVMLVLVGCSPKKTLQDYFTEDDLATLEVEFEQSSEMDIDFSVIENTLEITYKFEDKGSTQMNASIQAELETDKMKKTFTDYLSTIIKDMTNVKTANLKIIYLDINNKIMAELMVTSTK